MSDIAIERPIEVTSRFKTGPAASPRLDESTPAADTILSRLRANYEKPDSAAALRLVHRSAAENELSYRQWVDLGARFASGLVRRGVGRGDRVLILVPHSLDLYGAFVGALLIGAIPAIGSPPSRRIERGDYERIQRALVDNVDPRCIVTADHLRDRMAIPTSHASLICGVSELRQDHAPAQPFSTEAADPDAIAVLQYSSGTTGAKKGVALSHRGLLWQVDAYAQAIQLNRDDCIVSWLPLYHDMGLICCLLLPLLHRVALVAMCPFEWVQHPIAWAQAVMRHKGTLSWMPNFAFGHLTRSVRMTELVGLDLSTLRGVVNCGEPISAASQDAFLRCFEPCGLTPDALATCYAMAENTFAIASAGFGDPPCIDCVDRQAFDSSGAAVPVPASVPAARRFVASGRPLPQTSVRILDPDGHPLPERRQGEIAVRSPSLLKEYYRNPEATAAALRDGELLTGDLGYLADGRLFVTGRRDDLIIVRGHNIHPQDVEEVTYDVDGVIPGRVAAFGVDDAFEGTQELVILAETNAPSERFELLRMSIAQHVAAALDVVPRDIRLWPHLSLRKSTSGKISRAINRQRYLELRDAEARGETSIDPSPAPDAAHDRGGEPRPTPQPTGRLPASVAENESTLQVVRRCVQAVLSDRRRGAPAAVRDTEPLWTTGLLDSLAQAELLGAIERATGTDIAPRLLRDLAGVDTIAALAQTVDAAREQPDDAGFNGLEAPGGPEDIPMTFADPQAHRPSTGLWSRYYRWVFWRLGVSYGSGLRVLGRLMLRLDNPRNLEIGRNVTLMPGVDLKLRDNGRIHLHDGVTLDTNVRLVAANDARIEIGQNVAIGMGTIINAGADVRIGRGSSLAGYCSILASYHNYRTRAPLARQGYRHEPIYLGEDVWVGAHGFIGLGSRLGNGAVLGAHSFLQGDCPAYAVAVGRPARVIRFRGH